MTALILNCTPDQYLKDPCERPSLNRSVAHTLITKSPAHAYREHPRLGGGRKDPNDESDDDKKALLFGSVLHHLLLSKGKNIEILDFDSYRSKAAREARDEAIKAGRTPIKTKEFSEIAYVAGHLNANLRSMGFDFIGMSEVAIEWTEQGANGEILCRTMLDHVFMSEGVIYELKSIRNAHPEFIGRNFAKNGYDIQYVTQCRALEALCPQFRGRIEHHFLFMELTPPYVVVPVSPSGAVKEYGESRWRRALNEWEKCMASKTWPAYSQGEDLIIDIPQWELVQELGSEWSSL